MFTVSHRGIQYVFCALTPTELRVLTMVIKIPWTKLRRVGISTFALSSNELEKKKTFAGQTKLVNLWPSVADNLQINGPQFFWWSSPLCLKVMARSPFFSTSTTNRQWLHFTSSVLDHPHLGGIHSGFPSFLLRTFTWVIFLLQVAASPPSASVQLAFRYLLHSKCNRSLGLLE
jgi:hypothetical protein